MPSFEEYFNDWLKVIDRQELLKMVRWLKTVDNNLLCPTVDKVFKAFELCPYNNCYAVFISQDPYPQKGRATGIAFGNSNDIPKSKLSPSLRIIKDSVINLEIPHNIITFDQSLESWAKQGILMLNSALTCEVGKVNSHVNIWRPFMTKFIRNLSTRMKGLVYVLFGNQAQSLEPCIMDGNFVFKVEHPAYFARLNKDMPSDVFIKVNDLLKKYYNIKINWYEER